MQIALPKEKHHITLLHGKKSTEKEDEKDVWIFFPLIFLTD